MVYKMFFCSEFADTSDKLKEKWEEREKEHTQMQSIMCFTQNQYCCVLFDYILSRNVDKIVQRQHLNQYIYIYLHRECR